jgi:hypothetical protein
MGERIQRARDTLDFFVLVGYASIKPEIDRVGEHIKELITIAKHPLASYILYKEEKACRNMDCWERRDHEIELARGQTEYLL